MWEKDTKNEADRRIVLDRETVLLLTEHRERCALRARAINRTYRHGPANSTSSAHRPPPNRIESTGDACETGPTSAECALANTFAPGLRGASG